MSKFTSRNMHTLRQIMSITSTFRASRASGTLHRSAEASLRGPSSAQQRSMASTRVQRLTVQQKKKVSRALARSRRAREASIATVLGGETWSGYEESMRKGLRELDEMDGTRKRGTYASKPLVSQSPEEEEEERDNRMSALEAWADRVEDIWNEILQADSLSCTPRISLPGFPIEIKYFIQEYLLGSPVDPLTADRRARKEKKQVVKVKIARDYGHQKIFWDLAEGGTRPPVSILRKLHEERRKGHNAKLIVLKTTAERLQKYEGFLRASLAKRLPMRRVPEVRWQHISEMPVALRLEM